MSLLLLSIFINRKYILTAKQLSNLMAGVVVVVVQGVVIFVVINPNQWEGRPNCQAALGLGSCRESLEFGSFCRGCCYQS